MCLHFDSSVTALEIAYICNFIVSSQVKPNPNSDASKKQQVEEMFDNISPRYDFLNHFLSLCVDYSWRTKVRKNVNSFGAKHILDVATGTADLAIEMTKIEGSNIVGVDISQGMLDFGQIKLNQKNLTSRIRLTQADSEKLPFQEGDFDAVTVSFGVRNFENLLTGLAEMHRVLKPGGPMVVLEANKAAIDAKLLEFWNELPPFFISSAETKVGRDEVWNFIKGTLPK